MNDEKQTPRPDLRLRTKQFALRIIRMSLFLPENRVGRILGDQVLRSATSVAANYREAYRARSRAELISKCGDSQKELEETILWLELLADSGTVKAKKLALLQQEADELMAIFSRIIKSSRGGRS
jgi:four helix bundle protein